MRSRWQLRKTELPNLLSFQGIGKHLSQQIHECQSVCLQQREKTRAFTKLSKPKLSGSKILEPKTKIVAKGVFSNLELHCVPPEIPYGSRKKQLA